MPAMQPIFPVRQNPNLYLLNKLHQRTLLVLYPILQVIYDFHLEDFSLNQIRRRTFYLCVVYYLRE